MPVIPDSEDAFGRSLLDHLERRPGPPLILERDDGSSGPALQPPWFFAPYLGWPWWERRAIDLASGRVLDLGAGAGRHALHLQDRGHEVTAVDWSPGAVRVCRLRGVRDARLADLRALPSGGPWDTVLLMGGNLGVAGDWGANRDLLVRLREVTSAEAILVGDSVDPASDDPGDLAHQERNRRLGLHAGHIRLRLRYGTMVTPWWSQLNIPAPDVAALVLGTGWFVEDRFREGDDHVVGLRREGSR